MIFVVDGTGDEDTETYAKEMADGFCRRLVRKASGRYWRGPTLSGWGTTDIADDVVAAVVKWRKVAVDSEKLFLAGHSRGGAAVIFAAKSLKAHGIEIEAMFLFDAVDRTFNIRSANAIPDNVRHCFHALRDPSLAVYYSDGVKAVRDRVANCIGLPTGRRTSIMDDRIDQLLTSPPVPGKCSHVIEEARLLIEQDNKMKIVMRSTTFSCREGVSINFGNCGVQAEGQCKLKKQYFLGSHGALGGAPIVDERAPKLLVDSDRAAMVDVDVWMSAYMCQFNVFNAGKIRD